MGFQLAGYHCTVALSFTSTFSAGLTVSGQLRKQQPSGPIMRHLELEKKNGL